MNDYDNPFDYALGPVVTHYGIGEQNMDQATEALSNKNHYAEQTAIAAADESVTKTIMGESDDDEGSERAWRSPGSCLPVGKRGFLAIIETPQGDITTVSAENRKQLRQRIAQLSKSEAIELNIIEVYRATRLPLAKQVNFKF